MKKILSKLLIPASLIDNLEIMVDSRRICCQGNSPSNIDTCGFSVKDCVVENVYTLANEKDRKEDEIQRLNKICQQYLEKKPSGSTFILVHLRHNNSAWVSNLFLRKLKKGPRKLFNDLKLPDPLLCVHSHSKAYKYNERDSLHELKKGVFRWSSFSMSHQINFMTLNGKNLEIEIT